jgi:hypothetical protein
VADPYSGVYARATVGALLTAPAKPLDAIGSAGVASTARVRRPDMAHIRCWLRLHVYRATTTDEGTKYLVCRRCGHESFPEPVSGRVDPAGW